MSLTPRQTRHTLPGGALNCLTCKGFQTDAARDKRCRRELVTGYSGQRPTHPGDTSVKFLACDTADSRLTQTLHDQSRRPTGTGFSAIFPACSISTPPRLLTGEA
jgi:hypothetical protein